jgi:amino acid transporter
MEGYLRMEAQNPVAASIPDATIATGDIPVETAKVDKLHRNAIGLLGVLNLCLAGVAPMAAMFFNVPNMAAQAGAATPLVFILSGVGLLFLGVSIVYFSRRLSSAGGFYTWVRHGLGRGAAFQTGWLMLGCYALFEAAAQAAFGGLADLNMSTFLGVHLPGGWVSYALLSTALVCLLSYYDVKWSVRFLVPFLVIEIVSLLLLDLAITIRGGAVGQDFVHTFTVAGTQLKGVAPGGWLGIGVAMALGVWSAVGFETGAVYGEESSNPRRNVPVAIFSVIAFIALLYIFTTYSATIGLGWTHAGDTLGNIAIAPEPYYNLANNYIGGWLKAIMIVAVTTSTFASCLAFHNAMVRYFYAMGREGILAKVFGKTHPRWKSPYIASFAQSIFTAIVVLFLGLVIQKANPDGSISYALGFADGKVYTQTGGIGSYAWLAIIGTIALLVVYIMTNIAAPMYALRSDRKSFNWFTHAVAPLVSSLILLIPLISFVAPPIPVVGTFFTNLGFFPTPFPLNILPLFVILWVIAGLIYSNYLARQSPERYEAMGRIVRSEV